MNSGKGMVAFVFLAVIGLTAAFTGQSAADVPYNPAITKVMSFADIFGNTVFEGDVDVNASGQWIAASRKGVFLSLGSDHTQWQEVFATGGAAMVSANTVEILCRISNSGSWVVLNRARLYLFSPERTDAA